jgi:hypothetical protein
MSERLYGERTIEHPRPAQTTRILIELRCWPRATRTSEQLYQRVFEKKSDTHLPSGALRKDWPSFAERWRSSRARLFGRRTAVSGRLAPARRRPLLAHRKSRRAQPYDAMSRLGFLNDVERIGRHESGKEIRLRLLDRQSPPLLPRRAASS